MKQILKSLLRYKTSLVFNLIGLSTAFAVVIIIAITVKWENSFDKFHNDYDRLYRFELGDKGGNYKTSIPQPLAEVITENNSYIEQAVFEDFWAEQNIIATIDIDGNKSSYNIQTASYTPNFFTYFLDFKTVAGDLSSINNYDNVIICQSLAETIFGNISDAIGKSISLGTKGECIIGAVYQDLPENSIYENRVYYRFDEKPNAGKWNNYATKLHIKLNKNVDPTIIPEIMLDIMVEKGVLRNKDRENVRFNLRPIHQVYFTENVHGDTMKKGNEMVVKTLEIVSVMILIISLINFINFYFSSAATTMRSMVIRRIMGQTRIGAFMQVVLEALTLFTICIIFAIIGISVFNQFAINQVDLMSNINIILMLFVMIMFIGGILSFLYAKYVVVGNVNFSNTIQKTKKRGILYTSLVIFQFLVSSILIAVSLYMIYQMNYINNKDLGYDKENVLKFTITSKMGANYEPIRNDLIKISQIKEVAFSVDDFGEIDYYGSLGRKYKNEDINYDFIPVSSTFLNLMNIEIINGSDFRESDNKEITTSTQMSYIFNKKAQDIYNITPGDSIENNPIRGVCENFHVKSLRKAVKSTAFAVFHKNRMWVPMKNAYCKLHNRAGEEVKNEIREVIAKFDPSLNVEFTNFEVAVSDSYKKENSTTTTIILFSLISIMLSLMGVIGQIYYEIQGRVAEISVRKVFGSTRTEILYLFLRKIAIMASIAFVLSVPISYYAITVWSQNFAYVAEINPLIFVVTYVIVLLLVSGLVVTVCWKSASQNPTKALK